MIKNIFCLLLLLLGANALFAQPDLPSEEVEVIKDFEASLEESEKLVVEPALPPVDETEKNLTYDVPVRTVKLDYLPPKIRPLALKREKLDKTYNGFAKLGAGIPNSLFGELGYNYSDPKRFTFTGALHHHSANYKKIENQRFSRSGGNLNGDYYLDNGLAVAGYLGFNSDELYYYGYDDSEITRTREQAKQRFNLFDVGLKAYNAERTQGDINYEAGFNLYRLTDNYATGETGIDIQLGGTKWFADKHPLNIKLITDFTTYDDTIKQTLHNFFLQPNFAYHANRFKVKVGVNLASHNDKFYFFPDAEVAVNILSNKLAAFAGASGDLQKNNLRSFSSFNPFIATFSRLELENTILRKYYGGLRGNLSFLDYQVEGSYKDAQHLPLYLTDPTDTVKFIAIYDTVRIFTLKGTITTQPIKGLEVTGTIGQNIYNLEKEDKPWHLPSLEANVDVRYTTMEDRLVVKANLFVENGVPYKDERGNVGKLNGLFDIGVGAQYRFSENFGVFLDINNLANNKRQRWFRYETYGINILGGMTARF